MKSISVTFEDDEFNQLIEKKGKISWHDFIVNHHLKKKTKKETKKSKED